MQISKSYYLWETLQLSVLYMGLAHFCAICFLAIFKAGPTLSWVVGGAICLIPVVFTAIGIHSGRQMDLRQPTASELETAGFEAVIIITSMVLAFHQQWGINMVLAGLIFVIGSKLKKAA